MGMKRFATKCSDQLDDLIVGVRDTKGNKEATKKINTLIIIDVHARDIIDKFVRDSVLDEREFAWESQLRFSWDREADDVLRALFGGAAPTAATPAVATVGGARRGVAAQVCTQRAPARVQSQRARRPSGCSTASCITPAASTAAYA